MLERIMDLHLLLYTMTALGALGAVGMLAVHLTYRRAMRKTKAVMNLKEKWLNLWKTRDRLLNRMNLLVWGPSLLSAGCLGLALFLATRLELKDGLSMQYLYIGTAVPVILLLLRQALDFTYREDLVMNSLADYILQPGKEGRSCCIRESIRNSGVREAGSCVPGGNGRKDHCKHPADGGYGKSFQQNAESGRRGNYEGDHQRVYELIQYRNHLLFPRHLFLYFVGISFL